MKIIKLFPVLIFIPVLASCNLTVHDGEDQEPVPEEIPAIEEENSLYTDETETGIYVFETNETRYLNRNGYTVWTTKDINEADSFEPITVSVMKQSGRSEAGFGIVFCAQEIEGKPFLITVLINTDGLYTVGKVVDGVFSHLNKGWQGSYNINRGYGIRNVINVSYDDDKKYFLLMINGNETTVFTVSEDFTFKNSRSGFVTVIANNEDFPRKPVKVTFEKTGQ